MIGAGRRGIERSEFEQGYRTFVSVGKSSSYVLPVATSTPSAAMARSPVPTGIDASVPDVIDSLEKRNVFIYRMKDPK